MDIPPNPIRLARESHNLSRKAFAVRLGRSYERLGAIEAGYLNAIPASWFPALYAAGFDAIALNKEYLTWRANMGAGPGAAVAAHG